MNFWGGSDCIFKGIWVCISCLDLFCYLLLVLNVRVVGKRFILIGYNRICLGLLVIFLYEIYIILLLYSLISF